MNWWCKLWCYQCGNVGRVVFEDNERYDMYCDRCRTGWSVRKT